MRWIGSETFSLTRLIYQRGLALILLLAFLNAAFEFKPLLGEKGLLPVPQFVKAVPFSESPSLFFFAPTDSAFAVASWLGMALACFVLIGFADRLGLRLSVLVWATLWVLYISFVNVGQAFYGFGWESITLEATFYAIFLGSRRQQPQTVVIWTLRWLLFRVMFGAGLIKLRGDPCWRNLTCLNVYYETQPIPGPLSWAFHWAPLWFHKAGVLFNHFSELVVPFGYFLPQPIAVVAGLITIAFQILIFSGGNLSRLNALTIVLAVSTFDDRFLSGLFKIRIPVTCRPNVIFRSAAMGLGILVVILSIQPVRNMLSRDQIMNTVYNRFHLVGTYGAFGSVTQPRYEVVVEGAREQALGGGAAWLPYEFKGKPGDPGRMPSQISPYHLRLDWLMWFAALSSSQEQPWFAPFMRKLLEGDRGTLSLLRSNPFPACPPKYVRASLFEYHFTTPAEHRATGIWWTRRMIASYFPPTGLSDPFLTDVR